MAEQQQQEELCVPVVGGFSQRCWARISSTSCKPGLNAKKFIGAVQCVGRGKHGHCRISLVIVFLAASQSCISLSASFICISSHRSTYPCRNILRLCRNSCRPAPPCHTPPPPCSKCPGHSSRPPSRSKPPPSCSSSSPPPPGSTRWRSNPSPPHNNPGQPCLTSYAALRAGWGGPTFKRTELSNAKLFRHHPELLDQGRNQGSCDAPPGCTSQAKNWWQATRAMQGRPS